VAGDAGVRVTSVIRVDSVDGAGFELLQAVNINESVDRRKRFFMKLLWLEHD